LLLTAALLTACPVPGRADEKATGVPHQTGAITGRVADQQSRPVAGAEVWGVAYQEKFGPTRSGPDGRFRLPALNPDKPVTVWADAPNLARERRDDVRVFPGQDHDIGRLTLLPGTRMHGRTVDAKGKPVAGATVKLEVYRHQLGHTISSQQTEWTFRTDRDGRFDTPPLPAGQASFSLAAPGKVRTPVGKKAEPGTPVVDLGDVTLPDEMPVSGVVADGEGKPAPGVVVTPDYDWQNTTTTDKDGRFNVHGVGKDIKVLRLQSNDYFAPKPFDVAPGQTGLKLTVIKAYEIHGTAVDAETGKPVTVETVRLCRVERDPNDGHLTFVG
jgi:5-hydroxyisourate hydrolase-like protein (transthyretin family)